MGSGRQSQVESIEYILKHGGSIDSKYGKVTYENGMFKVTYTDGHTKEFKTLQGAVSSVRWIIWYDDMDKINKKFEEENSK